MTARETMMADRFPVGLFSTCVWWTRWIKYRLWLE
jgi:hypothetical protein